MQERLEQKKKMRIQVRDETGGPRSGASHGFVDVRGGARRRQSFPSGTECADQTQTSKNKRRVRRKTAKGRAEGCDFSGEGPLSRGGHFVHFQCMCVCSSAAHPRSTLFVCRDTSAKKSKGRARWLPSCCATAGSRNSFQIPLLSSKLRLQRQPPSAIWGFLTMKLWSSAVAAQHLCRPMIRTLNKKHLSFQSPVSRNCRAKT